MQPKISVLITTHNSGKYIARCIKSVIIQTYSLLELIIIDDGSKDDTEKIVKSFRDNRILYYKIEHLGRSKALNYGLLKCNCDWIAILDADDLWHPQKLELQSKFLTDNNNFVICSAAFFCKKEIKYLEIPNSDINKFKMNLKLHPGFTHCSVIYYKPLIISLGGYDEKLFNAVDYDLWLRLMDKVKIIIIDKLLVYVQLNEQSLSRKNSKVLKNNVYKIQKKYLSYDIESIESYAAWREYFYGRKETARNRWLQNKYLFLNDYRVSIGFIFTFLPKPFFEKILSQRFRLRAKFIFKKILRDGNILEVEKYFKFNVKDT